MTDSTAPAADEQPHPFDPAIPSRIAMYLDQRRHWGAIMRQEDPGVIDVRAGAELTTADVAGLLERDAYAEQTRLQLAEACATLRQQRNDALAIIDRVTARMQEYAKHGSGSVNVRQVLNLLSPTWPDGNYEAPAPTKEA